MLRRAADLDVFFGMT